MGVAYKKAGGDSELKPQLERSRIFGDDTMTLLGEITAHEREPYAREIWESQKKCGRESAVRVDVFSKAGKLEHITVSERKDGKPFKSEFNSSLEPVAEKTTASPEMVGEQRKKLGEFLNAAGYDIRSGEFSRFVIGRTPGVQTIVNVQGTERHIYLNKNIASTMRLEEGTQCKWERGEGFLTMTPLKETAISVKVQKIDTSLLVTIPEDMLAVGGLKRGDLVVWVEKESQLSPRKCEEGAPNAVKIRKYGGSLVVPIPTEMVEKQKVERGEYGIWTFDENRALWLEVGTENSHDIGIAQIWKNLATFVVRIPRGMREWPEVGEAVILEVKDGKLFVRPKQA